ALHGHAAVAVAAVAGVGDDGPATAAARAGALDGKEPLALNDDAVAVAAAAGGRPAPLLGAAAAAIRAQLLTWDGERLADALGGFEQVDLDGVLQVAAGLRAAASAAAVEDVAEQVAEDVEDAADVVEVGGAVEALQTRVAVAVVAGALVRITE